MSVLRSLLAGFLLSQVLFLNAGFAQSRGANGALILGDAAVEQPPAKKSNTYLVIWNGKHYKCSQDQKCSLRGANDSIVEFDTPLSSLVGFDAKGDEYIYNKGKRWIRRKGTDAFQPIYDERAFTIANMRTDLIPSEPSIDDASKSKSSSKPSLKFFSIKREVNGNIVTYVCPKDSEACYVRRASDQQLDYGHPIHRDHVLSQNVKNKKKTDENPDWAQDDNSDWAPQVSGNDSADSAVDTVATGRRSGTLKRSEF